MTGTGPLELLAIDHLLTEEERDIQASVREFVDRRVRPGIADAFERGEADLTLLTFGNGVPMSLRVARRLAEQDISAEVVDLRWLAPLPMADVLAAARRSGRVLVVDETRRTGGVGEGVVTGLVEAGFAGPIRRVASQDSFIPLGPAAAHVLLGEEEIEKSALELFGKEPT